TKAATLGIGAFLLASVTDGLSRGEDSFHEILVLAFIFVTAPISANFISKVNLHSRACDLPSSPKTDGRWSTFDVHELDRDVKPHPDADF
ncbi:MAG: monovalent cation/H(+) antiporter subunit G, partial [Pseudomonadota bacterium]